MIKLKTKDFIKKASTFSHFANPEGTRLTKEIKNIKGNVESSSLPNFPKDIYGHALADNLGNNGLYGLNHPDVPVNILKEELPDDSDIRTPKYLRAIKPSYFSHPREAAGFESRLARYLRQQNNKGMPYDNESQDALNIMKNPNFKFENNPSLQLDFNRYQNDLKNKSKEYKGKLFEEISNRIPYLAFNNINNSNMNINQLHNKFNKTAAAGLASALVTNNDPAKDPASRAGDMWQGALASELGAGTGAALGLVLSQLLAKNAKPETQTLAAILGALSGYAGGGILGHKASKALAANRDKKREALLSKTASKLQLIAKSPKIKNPNIINLGKITAEEDKNILRKFLDSAVGTTKDISNTATALMARNPKTTASAALLSLVDALNKKD